MQGSQIRVLIVDDSAFVRKRLTDALAADKQIEVVGTASDAFVARDKVLALNPDVVTLDIEMPKMDGITFLRKLMKFRPIPVIVISSLGQAGCQATVEALRAGAIDVLCKPDGPTSVGHLATILPQKVRAAASARTGLLSRERTSPTVGTGPHGLLSPSICVGPLARDRVVAIGASTGGPGALADVLQPLPKDVPPIVVVQHMPPVFTRHFAKRLNEECAIEVKEAEDQDELIPGRALIAPGDLHMTLKQVGTGYRVQLLDGPPVCFSKPSVDVLFSSVAKSVGKRALGILLTGMGADGARGLLEMRNSGASTIAQNEATCVVFGMPKEAIRMGAAQTVLPLGSISRALLDQLRLPVAKSA